MSWNHRLMRRKLVSNAGEEEIVYGIVEAYYDDNDVVDGWTLAFVGVEEDSVDGVKKTLERMLKCLEQPILDEEELLSKTKEQELLSKTKEQDKQAE